MALSILVTGEPQVVVEMVGATLADNRPEAHEPWIVASSSDDDIDPDVIVFVGLHASLPPEADDVRSHYPHAPLVWVAGEPSGAQVTKALRRGCSSVVSQRSTLSELVTGVTNAMAGETWSTPDLLASVVRHIRQPSGETEAELSDRERQVLALLAAGRSTQDIARLLSISIHTARNHVRRILQKMNAHSRIEALQRARSRGLLIHETS